MPERKKPSARFAIVFLLILAAISLGVYLTFSSYQREMAAERKQASAQNLAGIGRALNAFAAKNSGRFPERAGLLLPEFISNGALLIHAAWPDRAGYVYIPGVRAGEDADRTLLVFENVPERKRKIGVQVLYFSGQIETLTEAEFIEKLKAQEALWKRTGRIWLPEEMGTRIGL